MGTDPQEADEPRGGLPEQVRVRREKLDALRGPGIDPYPVGYPRTADPGRGPRQVGELPPDSATGVRVGVTGRVMLKRDGGKLCFATLRDGYRRPAGDARWPASARSCSTSGSRTSTSATTSASPARSSPRRRGELTVAADVVRADQQVAAAAAGEAQGPDRSRRPGSACATWT